MRADPFRSALAALCFVAFATVPAWAQEGTTTVAPPPDGTFAKAIAGVFGQYMAFLGSATSNIFGALQGSFRPFAYSIVTLYVVVVGYKLLRGDMGAATKEFATSCFLIVFLSSLVFSPGVYQEYVFDPFIGTISDTTNFFVSKGAGVPINSAGDIFTYLGSTLEAINSINAKMDSSVGFFDKFTAFSLKVLIAQGILAGAYIACIAAYMYLVLQAWFAIFMYMIIGGVCVFMAAFKSSRFVAVAWFRSICHEGLTVIFAGLIMGISGNIIQRLVIVLKDIDVGANGIFTPQYFAVLLACLMGYLMLLKAPQLAASMSGGSAGSTAGVAAVVGGAAGVGYAGARTAGRIGLRGLGKVAGLGYDKTKGFSDGAGGGGPAVGSYSDRKGTSTGQG